FAWARADADSPPSVSRTSFFSSSLSQCASAGWSFSSAKTSRPSTMAGRPCIRNSHCQPCQPPTPFMPLRMAPHSGPVSTLTIVVADMKVAITWPRRALGYQFDAVEVGDHVRQQQQRQDAPADLREDRVFGRSGEGVHGGCLLIRRDFNG